MATVKVKFRPSSVPGKAGTVVYQVIHLRQVRLVTAGVRLQPDQWEALQHRPSFAPLTPVQKQVKGGLMLLHRVILALEGAGQAYTADDVVRRFRTCRSSLSFTQFMGKEIRTLVFAGKPGTARNRQSALRSFSAFLGDRDMPFSAFTEELVGEYDAWLAARGLSRNSRSFYLRILRVVYNKAVSCGLAEQTFPFGEVYTGVARTRKRAVREEVIARLLRADWSYSPALSLACDLFIFSYCMRGMPFIDMAYLKKSDIRGNFVRYFRRKTGQLLEVRLEPLPARIVRKYAGKTAAGPYVFPLLKTEETHHAYRQYQTALRYYNRQLKRLSALLKLDVELSSYTTRHSWATAARNHQVPISVISAGMGHTSEKTTRIYLASLENAVIDEANRKIVKELERTVSGKETVHFSRKGSKTN